MVYFACLQKERIKGSEKKVEQTVTGKGESGESEDRLKKNAAPSKNLCCDCLKGLS